MNSRLRKLRILHNFIRNILKINRHRLMMKVFSGNILILYKNKKKIKLWEYFLTSNRLFRVLVSIYITLIILQHQESDHIFITLKTDSSEIMTSIKVFWRDSSNILIIQWNFQKTSIKR